jgi:cell division septation protein DedD
LRRSRRIYKKKSRSNLETLIILVGAIIILSVAFYMAREKSFLPPEETNIGKMEEVEEAITQEDTDKQESEELLAKGTTGKEVPNEIGAMREPDVYTAEEQEMSNEEDLTVPTTNQDSQSGREPAEERVVSDNIIEEDNRQQEESSVSGPVYTVQVGYFSIENNARGLAKEIEDYGYQTYVLEQDSAYKVQVGAYPVRAQAEKASQELKNLGYEIWVTQR